MARSLKLVAALAACSAVRAQPTPPESNPFCSVTTQRNVVTTSALCAGAGVIDNVVSAFFGVPSGACPSFAAGSCDAGPEFAAYAKSECLGKPECTLSSANFSDPCPGVVKTIAAVFHCSSGLGGYQPLPAPPSPSCALNGMGCPPPAWEPTWNLTQSTVVQPGGGPGGGFFEPNHTFGLISLDWSVAQGVWGASGNPQNYTCEATLRANCAALKADGKASKCFFYHNTELALEWLEGQRAAMYEPANRGWFLQYLPGNPSNVSAGTILNSARAQGDQFYWNFTNLDAQQYYIAETAAALSDPAVDGTFTDDVDGFPAEHNSMPAAIGMGADQLAILRFATQQMGSALIYTLVAGGKYTWQAFGSQDTSAPAPGSWQRAAQLGVTPALPPGRRAVSPSRSRSFRGAVPSNAAQCTAYMRQYCDPSYQGRPLLQHHDPSSAAARNASVASFLITRPAHAYLGFGWESDDRDFDPLFYLQVGTPTGLCAETGNGTQVFQRAYTLGTAQLDCNTFTAELPFGSLPLAA